MKGQSKEIVEFFLLVVGVCLILVISYFLFVSKTPSIRKLLIEKHQSDRINNAVNTIFYTKIPEIDKSLSQLLGDMITTKSEIIYYGNEWGGVNATKIVHDSFDNYFGKKWYISTPNIRIGYDTPSGERVRTFHMPVPLPGENGEYADVMLYVW